MKVGNRTLVNATIELYSTPQQVVATVTGMILLLCVAETVS